MGKNWAEIFQQSQQIWKEFQSSFSDYKEINIKLIKKAYSKLMKGNSFLSPQSKHNMESSNNGFPALIPIDKVEKSPLWLRESSVTTASLSSVFEGSSRATRVCGLSCSYLWLLWPADCRMEVKYINKTV